jgi:iron complex outermembrane recepter protein
MIYRNYVARAMAQAFGGLAVCALVPVALAQQQPTQQEPAKLERIEVTGSSIKRIDAETAVPVTVLRREDIEKAGVSTVAQLLEKVSVNNGQGYNIANALGDSARPGFAGASLRGLGPNNTLVLLNGRRLAVYAFDGGGVNLGQIPAAALERVEILRDGASAIYGTDAVGGVINFITRRDFTGGIIDGNFYKPEAAGGESYGGNLTLGFGDLGKDRFNIMGVASYNKLEAIKARDRSFSKTAFLRGVDVAGGVIDRTSANAFPANVFIPGVGLRNPTANLYQNGNGCTPPASFGRTPTEGQCRYDYASQIDIVPDQETKSILGRAVLQLGDAAQVFAEYSRAEQTYTFRISQTPASEATTLNGDPLLLPTSSRYYPTAWVAANFPALVGQPLNLYYRVLETGPRTNQAEIVEDRILGGVEGAAFGFDYKAGVMRATSKATERYLAGYMSEARLLAAMARGNINPFGFQDTAEGRNDLLGAQVLGTTRISKSERTSFDATASREIFRLPAGPVAMAIGTEYREEKYNDQPQAVLNTGDIIGGGGTQLPVVAKRDVTAVFAELNAPIMKGLEATLAVRGDKYSDFGSTTNPKLGLRWTPSSAFLARASYSTGFRAPALPDLFSAQTQTNTGGVYDDPFYDSVSGGCAAIFDGKYCGAQLTVRQGGNPRLQPEESKSWTLGFIFEPTRNISFGLDYFSIKQTKLIGIISADTKLADYIDNFNPATLTSSSIYARDVITTRDPAAGNRLVIDFVQSVFDNVGDQNTSGVDLSVKVRLPATDIGRFGFNVEGSYIGKQESRLVGQPTFNNSVGTYATFGPVVRFKHNSTIDWERGPLNVALTYNYSQGYWDQVAGRSGQPRKVGNYETFDVFAQYKGVKNLTISGGVRNLLDRNPPFSNQNAYFQVGYDPTYTDPRGRTPYVRASYKFW